MTSAVAIDAYVEEATSWDVDRTLLLRRHATAAWCMAIAGWVCAVAAAVALAILMPLEHIEPFVVRVDSSTGVVDVVPVATGATAPDEVVTRYFLTHYLTVCERFNFSTAESDYEECAAFHSAQRNQAWYALWTASNPDSPLNLFKDGSSVRVQVKAVSFFTRASGLTDLAQVRYLKAVRHAGGAAETYSHWIASIQYAYSAPAKDPKTRRWNPLGFKIVDFKAEPEVSLGTSGERESGHAR